MAYKAFDMWQFHRQEQRLVERRKIEAEARQARMRAAADRLLSTRIEQVTARCGIPISTLDNHYQVILRYIGRDGNHLDLKFHCYKSVGCMYEEMERVRSTYHSDVAEQYETAIVNGQVRLADHLSQIEELPCLAGE
jgi:hypothetical protein